MDKDIWQTPDKVKLKFTVQRILSSVRICSNRYKTLLENPDFTYAEFLDIGGFPLLMVYEGMLDSLVSAESPELIDFDMDECYSYVRRIEEIYNIRWGIIK